MCMTILSFSLSVFFFFWFLLQALCFEQILHAVDN